MGNKMSNVNVRFTVEVLLVKEPVSSLLEILESARNDEGNGNNNATNQ